MQFVSLEELKEEAFKLIEALIDMRQKSGLTQADIAQKIGAQKSIVRRLESGKGNPSWKLLQNYAHACGFKIQLHYTQGAI